MWPLLSDCNYRATIVRQARTRLPYAAHTQRRVHFFRCFSPVSIQHALFTSLGYFLFFFWRGEGGFRRLDSLYLFLSATIRTTRLWNGFIHIDVITIYANPLALVWSILSFFNDRALFDHGYNYVGISYSSVIEYYSFILRKFDFTMKYSFFFHAGWISGQYLLESLSTKMTSALWIKVVLRNFSRFS